ncbi:MAG: hypothetical protein DYG89_13880 [Caldilinea sp. CFX5]|nr:hypothetical protein [Caldilinea sp. CFX5]
MQVQKNFMTAYPQIKLFGTPAITRDGQPVTGFISNKAAAAIYFIVAGAQTQGRDLLATLLWTNSIDTYAKKNLRNVLSNLRDLLGDVLEITRETVSLPASLYETVDSNRFLALFKQAEQTTLADQRRDHLAAAVALYQGPFLDGFHIADAEAFDEWLRSERERFGLLAIQALHELVAGSGPQGKVLEGINYATQLLKLDPLREETHRHLMQLLALDGQVSAALAQYRTCQKLLQSELGVDPDPETQDLYRRIQAGEFRKESTTALTTIPMAIPAAPPVVPVKTSPRIVLPAVITGFVGRVAEVAQVQQRLAEPGCRLLTITGMGGVGKTRLALRAGHALANRSLNASPPIYTDGIYFVPLAALTPNAQSEHQLPTAIAVQLQLPLSGATAPATQLIQALYDKDLLLILDNCEHLPMAPLLSPLLQETRYLQCLVTSRSRLNVHGEHLLQLSGLTTPDDAPAVASPGDGESDATRLFVQSVQAIHADFALDRQTTPLVTKICQLLHGLPLGIELAASWVRFLSLEEIAQEIQQNLDFLDTTLDAQPDPQRSLRAVFMNSYRLLSTAEQQVLRRLSVFRGGFTRAAATHITGATLPMLAALSDKSLLERTGLPADKPTKRATGAWLNYRLHPVIHQYAAEQLALAQEASTTQERHASYIVGMLAEQRSALQGTGQQAALQLIHSEIENVRAAWQWLIDHLVQGDVALADNETQISQGIDSLFHFYDMRSWFQEGEAVFGQLARQLATFATTGAATTTPDEAETVYMAWSLQAKAQARQGWFAFHLGRYAESRRLLVESLQRLQELDAEVETIFNLNYLGALLRHLGEFAQATTYLQEALRLARRHNDPMSTSIALNILGQIASLQGDAVEARRLCQEALQIKRTIGDRWGMTYSLTYLGRVIQASGDYGTAQKLFAESLTICEAIGDQRGAAFALQNLGDTAFAAGDLATAGQRYQESLALYRTIGNRAESSLTLARLGETYRAGGEQSQARQVLVEALGLAWSLSSTPGLLASLLGLAALDLAVGKPAEAISPLRYVYQHPASSQEQIKQAAQLLNTIGADMNTKDGWDVADYVETVLPIDNPSLSFLHQEAATNSATRASSL